MDRSIFATVSVSYKNQIHGKGGNDKTCSEKGWGRGVPPRQRFMISTAVAKMGEKNVVRFFQLPVPPPGGRARSTRRSPVRRARGRQEG